MLQVSTETGGSDDGEEGRGEEGRSVYREVGPRRDDVFGAKAPQDADCVRTRGAAHEQEFQIECAVADLAIRTIGNGRSRRIAEQQAAEMALQALKAMKS